MVYTTTYLFCYCPTFFKPLVILFKSHIPLLLFYSYIIYFLDWCDVDQQSFRNSSKKCVGIIILLKNYLVLFSIDNGPKERLRDSWYSHATYVILKGIFQGKKHRLNGSLSSESNCPLINVIKHKSWRPKLIK